MQALGEGEVAGLDPRQAKKRAEEEEEARAAAKRSLGTPVTPATFAAWRQRCVLGAESTRQNSRGPLTGTGQRGCAQCSQAPPGHVPHTRSCLASTACFAVPS